MPNTRSINLHPPKDFTLASHTFVVSDIHLADAEPVHPKNPLWKKFKQREFFVDESFKHFIEFVEKQSTEPVELVLNGDIFDFDSIMQIPENPPYRTRWLEKIRGLDAEELKSRYKMGVILDTHFIWVEALMHFIANGNRVIFVIGNHDLELHWHSVQKDLSERLDPGGNRSSLIRFVEWYYISNKDTLIEHGNQYDSFSMCTNPINPAIKKDHEFHIRIPFGNLAGKYMLNGMGMMNPHSESSFIKESLWQYAVFYYKYLIRIQPFLIFTWFWSAFVTLALTLSEGLRPALSDPLTISDRIDEIARKSNSFPKTVIALRELHAHPTYFQPIRTLQELWLDRAILFGLFTFLSFEFLMFFNLFARFSIWFFIVPFGILLPVYIFYARSVRSEVLRSRDEAFQKIPLAAKLTGVHRVILGHSHIHMHTRVGDVEHLNTGTWSPAFRDVECTQPYGLKCFAWLRPEKSGSSRIAELYEWKNSFEVKLPMT